MTFSAAHFYPQVRFKNGVRQLFNPVLKQTLVSLPEERVRLQYVDFLLHGAGWSKNRVGFEIPVQFQRGASKLRADLLLYDDKMNPFALGECKAPSVKLNEQTAIQAARYNNEIKAPWLFAINGIAELWFKTGENGVSRSEPPITLKEGSPPVHDTTGYWEERGFLSPDTIAPVKENLLPLLKKYWGNSGPVKYLQMNPPFLPFPAEHYYSFHQTDDKTTLAFTVLNNGSGSTRLLFTANRNRQNAGLAVINPETNEAELTLPAGNRVVNALDACSIDFTNLSVSDIEKLPQHAMNFFD